MLKYILEKISISLFFVLFLFVSCKRSCYCEEVVYISNIENNYIWEETDRKYSDQCEQDTMSGAYLDNLGNSSYVRTIIECD